MCNGTVKWFNEQKDLDSFPTMRVVLMYSFTSLPSWRTGCKTLKEGQKVTFEIEEDPHNNGKSRAANVCVVG